MSSKCTIKKTKAQNTYKVEFTLTAGETLALKRALCAYNSACGIDVAAYLSNAVARAGIGNLFPDDSDNG